MLTTCYTSGDSVARLRAGPAGQYLDGFAGYLMGLGYTPICVQQYVARVVHLMRVVALDGVTPETLREEDVRGFRDHLAACSCSERPRPRSRCLVGPRRFLEYLRDGREPPPRSPSRPPRKGLERIFKDEDCVARLRGGPAGRYLDGFADHLHQLGYASGTAQRQLETVVHMMRVAERASIAVESLDDECINTFQRHLASCRCRQEPRGNKLNRGGLRSVQLFVEHLRLSGIARPRPAQKEPALINRFCEWMRRHRGSAELTLKTYGRVLRVFLARVGENTLGYDAGTLRSFVVEYGCGRAKVAQAMRQFLRFLVAEGLCRVGLRGAIPAVAHWRLSSLPRYLPNDEVERIVAAGSDDARDRAILLLLSRLGLRNGDLRELCLGDIDWERGHIRVVGKSRREALLPLPQDVGNALLNYIETARPKVRSDRMFFTKLAPLKPIGLDTARGVVRRAIHRAAISDPPSHGCHLLRHSAATHMLRCGMTLEDIGVILRHRFQQTTEIYAKVDVDALREIAPPWPSEVP